VLIPNAQLYELDLYDVGWTCLYDGGGTCIHYYYHHHHHHHHYHHDRKNNIRLFGGCNSYKRSATYLLVHLHSRHNTKRQQ
jgi:hypothetical protein